MHNGNLAGAIPIHFNGGVDGGAAGGSKGLAGNGAVAAQNGAGNGDREAEREWWRQQLLRRVVMGAVAAVVLTACRWLAYQLRFDFEVPEQYQVSLDRHWVWVVPMQLGWLLVFRQFSGIYKYFSLPEIRHLAQAMAFSGITLYFMRYLDFGFSPPKGVILLQCMMGFLALGGMRFGWRQLHEQYLSRKGRPWEDERPVAIIGAGDVGANLVRELRARPNLGLNPVVFLDDNRGKWGSMIHGIEVVGGPERIQRFKEKYGLKEAVIAMLSASAKRLGEVIGLLQEAHLKYVTVPSVDQLTSGSVRVSNLRPVNIEDLLGRQAVDLRMDEIGEVLKDRVVLVTGAGGEHRE